jgi:hypothetical protein
VARVTVTHSSAWSLQGELQPRAIPLPMLVA